MAWLALRRISSVRAVSGHRVKLSDLGWPRRGRGCILWTTGFSSSLRPDPQAAPDGLGILGSRGKERKARGGRGLREPTVSSSGDSGEHSEVVGVETSGGSTEAGTSRIGDITYRL